MVFALLLAACGAAPPPRPAAITEPETALRQGVAAVREDRYFDARRLFAKAFAHYRSIDDSEGAIASLINLAEVELTLGEQARALASIEEAERIARREGSAVHLSRLALQRGRALRLAGEREAARELFDKLLADGDAIADDVARAALFERAALAIETGEDGHRWLERLASAAADEPERARQAQLAARLATELAAAEAHLREAHAIYRRLHHRTGLAAIHAEWGRRLAAAGRLAEARDHYDRALYIRLWLNDRVHTMDVLEAMLALEEQAGDEARAAQLRAWLEYMRGREELAWPILQGRYEELAKTRPEAP